MEIHDPSLQKINCTDGKQKIKSKTSFKKYSLEHTKKTVRTPHF